jgi:hypothetical protein
MVITILKALGTAAFIALLSEIAKRSSLLAAVLVALPLATILTVGFTATDDVAKANQFATSTFFMVWPGLAFFIVLPIAQRLGASFWVAFALAVVATGLASWGAIYLYKALGVKL